MRRTWIGAAWFGLLPVLLSAQVTYTPQPINFGSVKLGATSATLSTTLKNTGTDTLRFTGGSSMSPPTVPESGCSTTGFCWVTDNCTARPPGTTCVLQYRFSPKRVGAVTGANIVQTNHGPFPANFTGTGQDTVSVPVNTPPIAAFSASCTGLTCTFLSTSSDPDGSITAQSWAFGDGASATGGSPSHTYGAGGTYSVRLTVTDNLLAQGSSTQSVTVTAPPPPPVVGAVNYISVSPMSIGAPANPNNVYYLSALPYDSSGHVLGAALTWSIADTSVAKFNPFGISSTQVVSVSLLKQGTTTVTASAGGKVGNIALSVGAPLPPIVPPPPAPPIFGIRASWLSILAAVGCPATPGISCTRGPLPVFSDSTGLVQAQMTVMATFAPP